MSPPTSTNPISTALSPEFAAVRQGCLDFLEKQAESYDDWMVLQSGEKQTSSTSSSSGAKPLNNRISAEKLEIARYVGKKYVGDDIIAVRGRLVFPETEPAEILGLIVDLERRKLWDSQMEYGRVHVQYEGAAGGDDGKDEQSTTVAHNDAVLNTRASTRTSTQAAGCDLAHLAYKGALFVQPRDLCLLRAWHPTDFGCVLVAQSVADEAIPEKPGVVRAELRECGYWLKADGRGNTEATYISSLDFKGNIPATFTNVILRQQPGTLLEMRNILRKRKGQPELDAGCGVQ
ncbi:unnamed protein product [Amoebophrya sp. A120]|nr:unnamed protein product [Amoebophrya sp. A120]|eukprot:GSA120T00011260001.1